MDEQMFNHQIKMKAWLPQEKRMLYDYVTTLPSGALRMPYQNLYSEVIPLQYIGLKDKNNKEIYNGDIGRITQEDGTEVLFVVEWGIHEREMGSGYIVDIPAFAFVKNSFPSFPIVDNYLNVHDLDIIEIIGNKFENPEYLTND